RAGLSKQRTKASSRCSSSIASNRNSPPTQKAVFPTTGSSHGAAVSIPHRRNGQRCPRRHDGGEYLRASESRECQTSLSSRFDKRTTPGRQRKFEPHRELEIGRIVRGQDAALTRRGDRSGGRRRFIDNQ